MFAVDEDYVNSGEDRVSFGPRVGFMQSMAAGYDATVSETPNYAFRISNTYDEQDKRLRTLGESEVPTLNRIDPRELEALYSGEDDDADVDMKQIHDYDGKILALREKYPDAALKTTQEMWQDMKTSAQEKARIDSEQRRTAMGSVGAFVGGMGGSFDPRYNLLNTVTAPIGGVGKSIVTRALTEGGAQAVIEGVNEFTGQRQARRMRGLDDSYEGTIARIGLTAVGGAVIRGGIETGVAGVRAGRRWFSDTPGDPAPPPPKFEASAPEPQLTPQQFHTLKMSRLEWADPTLASSRMGASRVISDVDEVTRVLDDWSGDLPAHITPRTSTAIPAEVEGVRFADDVRTREAIGQLTIDEVARRVDPDAFRVYDKLAVRMNYLRGEIDRLRPDAVAQREAVGDINDKIDALEYRINKGSKSQVARKEKSFGKERDTLVAQRDATLEKLRSSDTPEMAKVRQELVATDLKMRNKSPVVSRAYARARGEWELGEEYRGAVNNMMKKGGTRLEIPDAPPGEKPPQPASPLTGTPVAARITPDKIGPDESFTDAALRTAKEDVKAQEETLTAFRESLSGLKEDAEEVMLGNHKLNLKDVVEVPNKNGTGSREITVRELLDELRDTDEDLKAVTKCST